MEGKGGDRRREVIATLVIVGTFVVVAGGRPLWRRFARHPTPERCAAMLDRYAEQQARSYERAPSPSASPRRLDAPDVLRCARDLTDAEVECALKAGYVDELERCLPP
ncbi:MAG: hypothetical protein QM820_21475 [Minicystis sp.]